MGFGGFEDGGEKLDDFDCILMDGSKLVYI